MSTVTRKPLRLKACPRCGGDICRVRDTFGVYHQCAQCGREIRAEAAPTLPAPSATINATTATAAAMNAASNPTTHRETLLV